jgi:hypothetical protein
MPQTHDLTQLNPDAFEHLVNALALRELGAGTTGFGPGADGGRDGYFEGESPYPSQEQRWSGKWYIQSKFLRPHATKDPQKWLLERISEELGEFGKSKRVWPDNWIVATNIDPSGTPETGSFDAARRLVKKARADLADRFHIWGGQKILDMLAYHPEIATAYGHFLTPGHVISAFYDKLNDEYADIDAILRHLVVEGFNDQKFTRLEEAGSKADDKPGIEELFVDLPFRAPEHDYTGMTARTLVRASSCCHRVGNGRPNPSEWRAWNRHPIRARVFFIKGGPGNGKSTIGQYFCQIQRAALLLEQDSFRMLPSMREIAERVRSAAQKAEFWPTAPRVPIYVELKDFAQWFGAQEKTKSRGILTYICAKISASVEQEVLTGTFKRGLGLQSWFVMFDGLDEVPEDVKDDVASAVKHFVDEVAVGADVDLFALCTSRPQGYSGQLSDLDGAVIELEQLSPEDAFKCAEPVINFRQSPSEQKRKLQILTTAIQSEAVRSLMTTPLQAHIIAVIVRSGEEPPNRRWKLFNHFYKTIKDREANRNLPDIDVAKLLREREHLLKRLHNRLGFVLHSDSEVSSGAQTSLHHADFERLATDTVTQMTEESVAGTVKILMRATAIRLVLLNTPDDGKRLRFDIRPLQEFFASEFLYESVKVEQFRKRLQLLCVDAHWREVLYFLFSALIEQGRQIELDVAVEVLNASNEGSAAGRNRMLARRLSSGALLAARLLQEGVLEEDKIVRDQFRKCLTPLLGSTLVDPLLPLIRVRQTNSLAWLLIVCCEQIQEADRSENIGAAILLSILLTDKDPRANQIKGALLSAPRDYIMTIFRARMARKISELVTYPMWVREIALTLLTGPRWHELLRGDITLLLAALKYRTEQPLAVAVRLGLPAGHVQLLSMLLTDDRRMGIRSDSYHNFTVRAEDIDFSDALRFADASSAPGILKLVYQIILFNKTKDAATLLTLIKFIRLYPEAIFGLPAWLLGLLPLHHYEDLGGQIEALLQKSTNDLNAWIRELENEPRDAVDPVASLHADRLIPATWEESLLPTRAGAVWTEQDALFRLGGFLPKLMEHDDVSRLLLKVPAILVDQPLLIGQLLMVAPIPLQDQMRKAAVLHAANMAPRDQQSNYIELRPLFGHAWEKLPWISGLTPFALHLPEEAPLLSHLINAVTFRMGLLYLSSRLSKENVNSIAGFFCAFAPDATAVTELAQNPMVAEDSRAAARILLFLHAHLSKADIKHAADLLKLSVNTCGAWYFRALVVCLNIMAAADEQEAEELMGIFLEISRNSFVCRPILEEQVMRWREKSTAPITTAKVQQAWLQGG